MPNAPDEEDPFVVLGVARDITDRELKKRYFALMREFPPETHPDEFARHQRAWEFISDPERRASFVKSDDPYDAVAEPWRTRLREALQLLRDDNIDLAQVNLKVMLQENPQLDEARELLQQLAYAGEQWPQAEIYLRDLIKTQPANTLFLSRLVLTLGRLDRHSDALAVARNWVDVTNGKDVFAWVYVAETLSAQKQFDKALKQIEEGLLSVEEKAPLVLTRLQMRLDMTLRPPVAMKALKTDLELLTKVAQTDEAHRKALNERLQSMAALFFNKNRTDEANALIAAGRALWSQSNAVQFPPSIDAQVADLPPASREWLEAEAKEAHVFHVPRRGKVADLFLALACTAPTAFVATSALAVRSEQKPADVVVTIIALSLCAALTFWAWRQVVLSFTSKHKRMVAVHPLYLLEVGLDALRAWPLVNFGDVRVVHHHTNGVYTNSIATLHFGSKKLNVSIRNQERAVQLAQTLQSYRYRALQLLHGGMLEAEAGYDFIPPSQMLPAFVSPSRGARRKSLAVRMGAIVVIASVMTGISAVLGARAHHRQQLASVLMSQRVEHMAKLFTTGEDGEGQAVARKWYRAQLDQRGPQLLNVMAIDAERSKRLGVLLGALRSTEIGGLTVVATIDGGELAPKFSRWVEDGFTTQRSWLAQTVIGLGVWKGLKTVELRVDVKTGIVEGIGIGPDGDGVLMRLTGTASLTDPSAPTKTASFPFEVSLTEGEVLALSGADVAAIQMRALAEKLGRLLADELGVGHSAVAVAGSGSH